MVFTRGRMRTRSRSRSRSAKRTRIVSRSRTPVKYRGRSRSRVTWGTRKKFKSLRARKREAGLTTIAGPRCKTFVPMDDTRASAAVRTFRHKNLCQIPHNGANAQNARNGQEAHIVGFRHRQTWENISGEIMKLHQYWVIPKIHKHAYATSDLTDDFYTRHGLPDDNDGDWGYQLDSYLYDEPVNPLRYTVIKKKKTLLAPSYRLTEAGFTKNTNPLGSKPSIIEQDFWIPLNRKFTYGSLSDAGEVTTYVEQPSVIYIEFLCPIMQPGTGQQQLNNLVYRDEHVITFFRDGTSGM